MSRAAEVLSRFRPVRLSPDLPPLTPDLRAALPHLRQAMDATTAILFEQQDEGLPGLVARVEAGLGAVPDEAPDPALPEFLRFFKGPWNPLTGHRSVVAGVADRRPGCAFYPPDLASGDFDAALAAADPDEREALSDPCTVIRRWHGRLVARPYHEVYRDHLERIALGLREAATLIEHRPLADYLELRAASLLAGTYREADAAWVRLRETPLEVVIGPYEVYADGLRGLKATYEAMLIVTDPAKAAQLRTIEDHLDELSAAFPVPAGARAAVGGMAPIVVGHQIYAAGDAAAGIMASAFNLPNDPWVRGNVGWKQVMVFNVMRAKFENCGLPIAEAMVEDGGKARFEPYFFFVLLHEVSHGLGPAFRADGRSVARCLGSHYTALEECKADIGSVFLLLEMGGRAGLPDFGPDGVLDAWLPGLFRAMRFGLHEAHGAANIIAFNWFRRRGVICERGGRFAKNPKHFREATCDLLAALTTLQAAGTEAEAAGFLAEWARPGAELEQTLGSLADIPVDVRVEYPRFG